MSKVRDGNLDVLQILFERHHKHVFNFVYKMCGDRMHSEDIVQEVFYNVMNYRASYKNGKFVSWLFTIARNSLKKHYRKSVDHSEDLNVVSAFSSEEESTTDYSKLHLAINQLERSDKELLVLNRFQEIRYDELAEIVGSTPGAVKAKVNRALKKLRVIYFNK